MANDFIKEVKRLRKLHAEGNLRDRRCIQITEWPLDEPQKRLISNTKPSNCGIKDNYCFDAFYDFLVCPIKPVDWKNHWVGTEKNKDGLILTEHCKKGEPCPIGEIIQKTNKKKRNDKNMIGGFWRGLMEVPDRYEEAADYINGILEQPIKPSEIDFRVFLNKKEPSSVKASTN